MAATSKAAKWRSEEGLEKLRLWRQQQLSAQEIAGHAGVSLSTLQRWQRIYPEIKEALQPPTLPPAEEEPPQAAESAAPAGESAPFPPLAPAGTLCPLPQPPSDEDMDMLVQNALLRRAVGFQYDEYTYAPKTDPVTGETVLAPAKRTTKTVLPDISAQIYWLKNRLPSVWRDKPAETVSDQTVQVVFDTDEEADEE